ncbi:sugar phosphate isomerase/epimerase family protein [Botrimarina mediterranea]|uniref:Fructoselysine 3-epimerase n=1 Tax=Botrimarina mediterranea TaxID=2528022 RepID=A0A518K869_9BACT|nr:sugar phosphate isomerase/epimerase family protein [Botrimarina mediterranea]QDV73980.1 fructoselysine 3-epimerase [Botrimarina mediterranea]QDV78610.1 fructoselysine 3-epimerase [Planctomycetes bacterium K2D]
MNINLSRRRFGAVIAATAAVAAAPKRAIAETSSGLSPAPTGPAPTGLGDDVKTFRKAVKWGMIDIDGPPLDKFQLCQELGYDGMELISPGQPPIDELRAAVAQTGMPIHGLVNERHWQVRLSAPDQATRDAARAILEQAIRDAHAMGGFTVLLVPGVVNEEANHDQVWKRSVAEIKKVLPLASLLGVRVLIENVWNGFCETPEQLRDYLDEIDSPWVGSYYDIGNSQKFSASENWIRVLGSRIVKLDVKDWGVTAGFCKIGDGDVNWAAVREALAEINFSGWCTAEVTGGGRDELADISRRMDQVLLG